MTTSHSHEDDIPPPRTGTPPSQVYHCASPSPQVHTSLVSPTQSSTSFSATDEPLPGFHQVPRSEAQQPVKSELITRNYNIIPSHDIHKPPTRYFVPTLVLQNSGSVARDHLASERTFLAYVRTSLGVASVGVALVQLFTISDLVSKSTGLPLPDVNIKVQKFATPVGLSTLGMALIILFIGVYRYFLVQHSLPDNKFPPARLPIAFISFGLGAITVLIFGALLGGKVNES